MTLSRRQAADIRKGRRHASSSSTDTPVTGLSAAAAYELLLPKLARLRAVLATDGTGARPIGDVRRDHAELDHSLADAVAQAFAADALEAPTRKGSRTWVAEGLARSRERELASFAAADVCGVLRATTYPCPRWGIGPTELRPGSGHLRPEPRK